MAISVSKASKSRKIRERLKHPVIDADGHVIEFGPLLRCDQAHRRPVDPGPVHEALGGRRLGGDDAARASPPPRHPSKCLGLTDAEHARSRDGDSCRVCSVRRMDDFGLDFTIVYSTIALGLTREEDEEIRRVSCRAINLMFSELYREQADRMAPVAGDPRAYAPRGDRGTRVRRQDPRAQGGDDLVERSAHDSGSSTSRRRSRAVRELDGHALHGEPVRLRSGLGEVRRVGGSGHLALPEHGLRQPCRDLPLHPQPRR